MTRQTTFILRMAAILSLLMFALVALSGCAGNPQLRPTNPSQMMCGSLKGAHGHMSSAIYDAQQAKKFYGKGEGIPFIDANIFECEAGKSEILIGMTTQDKLNAEYSSAMARIGLLESENAAMKLDVWYATGVKVRRAWFWFKVTLFSAIALHFIGLIGGMVLTGPAGTILGTIGRLVNPASWALWVVEKYRVKKAFNTVPPFMAGGGS